MTKLSAFKTFLAGTALAGSDYRGVEGRLTFGPGETTKNVTVTILDDQLHEEDESFAVVLSNPTGGATLSESSLCLRSQTTRVKSSDTGIGCVVLGRIVNVICDVGVDKFTR